MRPRRRQRGRHIPSSSVQLRGWQRKSTREQKSMNACGALSLGYRLEIRLICLRYRLKVLVKMIAVVLGANDFAQRAAVGAPVALDRIPWRREGAGVFNMDVHLERVAIIDHAEALDHVQPIGMRRLIVI